MKSHSFIFIGRSGCGKGTQIKLLEEYLKTKDPDHKAITISTGEFLREFITGPSLTQRMCNEAYGSGGLQPEFITVHMWVKPLVENYTGKEHIFFDGTPRKYHEAGVLQSVFSFYKLEKPWVINIDISVEEATKRLLARKRMDDSEDDIRKRLAWYESDVVPTIGYYNDSAEYHFLKINGERPIEEIHADIVKRLNLD
ncbi:MAG: nucleoside monophosphate kinase [Candidatus Paceibacterota bacterium]